MELITIFQDSEQTVEIYKPFADYLEHLANSEFRLKEEEAGEVLTLSLSFLNNSDVSGKKIITSTKVPVLNRGDVFNLTGPYQKLEDPVLLLSEVFDLIDGGVTENWKQNTATYIEMYCSLHSENNIKINFLPEKVCGVSLFISSIGEKEVIILPISLNEDGNYYNLY